MYLCTNVVCLLLLILICADLTFKQMVSFFRVCYFILTSFYFLMNHVEYYLPVLNISCNYLLIITIEKLYIKKKTNLFLINFILYHVIYVRKCFALFNIHWVKYEWFNSDFISIIESSLLVFYAIWT